MKFVPNHGPVAARTVARVTLATALLAATLIAVTAADISAEERLQRTRIESADAQGLADELTVAGFDILEGSITARSIDVIVTATELDALRARGLAPELIDVGHPLASATAAVPAGYLNLAQITSALNDAAAAYPAICRVVDLTTTLGVAPTVEGRHMYALKISDNPDLEEDEPAFLLVACHHAREINTPVIALQAIQKLTTLYGSNPTVTSLIDGYEIWIAPVWNPDGYNYVFTTDNYWRKNRRPVGGSFGIDQNRNYPQGWSAPCGGSTSPSSDTYRGPSAASEAETQTMIAFSEQQRFDKVLDFHSYGRDILYGYACWTHPFTPWFQSEATALANAVGYGSSTRLPSAEGEQEEWQWAVMGAHAILVEIGFEFQPAYSSALTESGMIWPGILWMLQRPIPVWGHVTEDGTGTPVNATISYSGVVFPHGETNSSSGAFGRYRAFLPPGTYDLTFQASGYQTRVIPAVTVTTSSSQQIDVALTSTATSVAGGTASGGSPENDARDALSPARGFEHPVLQYRLSEAGVVTLDIFDVRGARVATLANGFAAKGQHAETWAAVDANGRPLPSGVYLARLTTARGTLVDKVVLAH